MTAFAIIASFVFGACIGSFLNVLIWRLPRERSIGGRSECPHCKHELAWYNLVPILSYIIQGGKCSYCKKPVSIRYPLIETVTGTLFALAFWYILPFGLVTYLLLLKFFIVIAICISVFVVDLEHYLILNKLVFPGIALMLVFALISENFGLHFILSGILAALPFFLIWYLSKGEWLGFGDVKFVLFMGLALGYPGILVALFFSFISGSVVGLSLIAIGKKNLSSRVPFGTFLTVATILGLFYGYELWNWYWGLFSFVV